MKAIIDVNRSKSDQKQATDDELIERFKKGDDSAFSTLVLKYQGRMVRAAQTILNDENEAFDIVQETFVKAYFNLKTFRGDSALYTWLYRILYNMCISVIRRKKIVSFLSFDIHDDSLDVLSKDPDPLEVTEGKGIMADVQKALKELPIRQRTIFVMKQIDGLKHGEISEILGITEGAVKASYFHAIKKLQVLLSKYGDAYEL